MPAVPMRSREQYVKAITVLERVGGTWQGVGFEEKYLVVTPAQFEALVNAGVVSRSDTRGTQSVARKQPHHLTLEEMLQPLRAAFQRRLAPPLGGHVYRFTLFLPVLSEGREVFTVAQRRLLTQLFHACFGGYTEASSEGNPPYYGSWQPPGGGEPHVDRHALLVVYTPQIEEAKDFFRQLRWILEQKHIANQQVILIEHTTAWLVVPSPPPGR